MFERKEKMDEMEPPRLSGWQFLCSGEQLSSGLFHAVVRYKAPPSDQVRTLVLDPATHESAKQALEHAKELAVKWAQERGGDGRGDA
jgi:hypothetical protein